MTDATQTPNSKRRLWFIILGAVVVIGAVLYGVLVAPDRAAAMNPPTMPMSPAISWR